MGQLSDSNTPIAAGLPARVRSRRCLAAIAAIAGCVLASASMPAFAAGPGRARTGIGASASSQHLVSSIAAAVSEQALQAPRGAEAHQYAGQGHGEESNSARHEQADGDKREQGASGGHEPGGESGRGRHERAGGEPQGKAAGDGREADAAPASSLTSRHGAGGARSTSIAALSRKAAEGLASVAYPSRSPAHATVHADAADASTAATPSLRSSPTSPRANPTAAVSTSPPETASAGATPSPISQPAAVQSAAPPASGRLDGASRHGASGRRSHTARRNRRSRAKSAASHTAPIVAADPRTVAAVASTHGLAARTAHRAATERRPPVRGRPSPIVTTITKIVDVVPLPVRILIGLLLALAVALGLRSSLTALRARRLEAQRGELLEDVGLLQAALLPVPPARLGPVGTSAAYRPAEGPGAGGDFYDVFALDDGQLAVIVGDISGHGRQALPHTALVRFTLRAYLEAGLSPRSAVQTAGAVLDRQLGESFATVVAATYHPRERRLVYACAGHPPPIVLGSRSAAPITACSSPPIGTGMRTGTRQTAMSVPGRCQVCFHTDGVTDARLAGELYGEERLRRALAELGSKATAAALLERVAEETDSHPDDMAACVLSVEGGAEGPLVLAEEVEFDRDELEGDRAMRFLLACGVAREETAEILRSACAVARREGTALVELCLAGGHPRATVLRNNVEHLHARGPALRAGFGGAR